MCSSPFLRSFFAQQLCTAGVYSGKYLPQPLDLGARVVPQGQQTGVRQRQLQRQIPCRRKGRVFHRAQKHAAPGKQIVVNTLVVFHHVPAWCGKRQAGLNNGKIHHFLIQRLIKQLLPGKIGQRQSAAPCERVLRRYDQVKGVVQDGGALENGPFYADKFTTALLLVCIGGLESDENCHTFDADRNVIPGLYVAGNVQGNRFATEYPIGLKGVSHSMVMYYGYVAGKNAMQSI